MLYVANATKQTMRHCFRVPEAPRITMVDIPSGTQKDISSPNWSSVQRDAVIDHLVSYGAKSEQELGSRIDGFSGIVYSINKPITSQSIEQSHDYVVDHQDHISASEATKSALAFGAPKTRNGKAKKAEIEVEQIVPAREKATGNEIKFGLSVEAGGADTLKGLPV